jgi:hypothetical protein
LSCHVRASVASRLTREVCEKIAQNVAQTIFCQNYYIIYTYLGLK